MIKKKSKIFFFILYERMKMRREESKIWKIRELDFRLTLKEVVLTKRKKKITSWNNWKIELSWHLDEIIARCLRNSSRQTLSPNNFFWNYKNIDSFLILSHKFLFFWKILKINASLLKNQAFINYKNLKVEILTLNQKN